MKTLIFFWRHWKWIFLCLYTVVLVRLIFKHEFIATYKNPQVSENISKKLSCWQGFTEKQIASMSNLGRVLYIEEKPPKPMDIKFTILVHKYGPFLERRHIKNFGDKRIDPFSACPVQNCRLTYEERDLPKADAVLVHLHGTCKSQDLPAQTGPRPPHQRWIFLTDESPKNAFLCGNHMDVRDFDGVFNWSMSYRYDADIPVPYGRTVRRQKPMEESIHKAEIETLLKDRKELAVILISNCGSSSIRWRYVRELAKHMPLEIIGRCGNKTMLIKFDAQKTNCLS